MIGGRNGGCPGEIDLVVSDVDGTLIDRDKRLTPRTVAAVRRLRDAGVAFSIVSARPPRGLRHVAGPLGLAAPLGGFNGGHVVTPDFRTLAAHSLAAEPARETVEFLEGEGVQVWVFDGEEWFLRDGSGPHVERETSNLQFGPTAVDGFDDHLGRIGKIVGVSDDHAHLAACEAELRRRLGRVSVSRSQDYYLDVTDCDANKGTMVRVLTERLGVEPSRVLAIGDGGNDLAMFAQAGLAVAMGQGSEAVRAAADAVTAANDAEGFAEAMESLVLGVAA